MEYVFIIGLILSCLKLGVKNRIKSIYIIGIIIAILFCGLRENVGRDFNVDKNIFEYSVTNKGYLIYFIISFFKEINLKYTSYFLFMAFTNLTFVYFLLKNNLKNRINKKIEYRGWLIYFLDMAYIYSFNGMRQGVANFIFLLMLKLKERKILACLLFIIGIGFHKSFVITIFLLFLANYKYNKKFFLIALIIAIISSNILDLQTIFIEKILPNIYYYGKLYTTKERIVDSLTGGLGLGYYYRILISILLIYFYEEIKKENPKELRFVNLSIFWCILKILTYKIWIIERVLDYLYFSNLISFPILFQKIEKRKYGKYMVLVILIGFFILFLKSTVFSNVEECLIPYKSILSKE